MRARPATGALLLALSVVLVPVALAEAGVVALQTSDPSCPDDSGDIYVDCGNGTVTDNRTGLVWLKDANCLRNAPGGGEVDWQAAMAFAAGLKDVPAGSAAAAHDCGLADGSSPGEWRLPSVEEWEAMVADAVLLGCSPAITDNQGTGCWISNPLLCAAQGRTCSFAGIGSSHYWSSTTNVDFPTHAWTMGLASGIASGVSGKATLSHYVWPVRGGQ